MVVRELDFIIDEIISQYGQVTVPGNPAQSGEMLPASKSEDQTQRNLPEISPSSSKPDQPPVLASTHTGYHTPEKLPEDLKDQDNLPKEDKEYQFPSQSKGEETIPVSIIDMFLVGSEAFGHL